MASNQVTSLFTASNGDVSVGYNEQGVQVVRNMYPASPVPDTITFERISIVSPLGAISEGTVFILGRSHHQRFNLGRNLMPVEQCALYR